MISLKPRSILQLTITGFLLVAGILIVTLIITARQLDGLSTVSQRMISESTIAMGASGSLLEQASAMERNARQYVILGERDILQVYADRRRTFGLAAEQLSDLQLGEEMTALLAELLTNEALAYEDLRNNSDETPISYYPQLIESAYRASFLVSEWINEQLENIRLETEESKRLLTLQSWLLVSTALVLAGIFTVLITAPLIQVEKAISQLGSGFYRKEIAIRGPRDLVELGERLDWLRGRLSELEQQRTSFLRHVSHELKTPLASMQESAFLLRDGVVGPLTEEQKEIIRIQSNNCERLQILIDNLLRHNEESFSVLNAIPEPVRLEKVVENVIAAHELTIKTRKLTIKTSLEKPCFNGNPEQLRVIVDNLVTNAIKFSPEQGKIEVYLRMRDGIIELGIIDQGPGIVPEEQEKIFEAFYQGMQNGSNNDSNKGSGLGLAIVAEYIQANGGRIEVVPQCTGAHFRVSLPAGNDLARS